MDKSKKNEILSGEKLVGWTINNKKNKKSNVVNTKQIGRCLESWNRNLKDLFVTTAVYRDPDLYDVDREAFEKLYKKYFPTIIVCLSQQNTAPTLWENFAKKALIHILEDKRSFGHRMEHRIISSNDNNYVSDILSDILSENNRKINNHTTIKNDFIESCLKNLNAPSNKPKCTSVCVPIVYTPLRERDKHGKENVEKVITINSFCSTVEEGIKTGLDEIYIQTTGSITEKERSILFANDLLASVSMVGKSKAILDTFKMINLVAASQCNPVLIVGETGTGKELAAKAIHTLRHQNGPFVAVNCSTLTANLLDSELFGYEKGSFTGADREKTGLLEIANSGTLFLDEISGMPIELQYKLLRVLQEKKFRKIGSAEEIPCGASIVVSSNSDLNSEISAGRFRSDLYYRLNICPIIIPSLRKRKGDIKLLAEYFLKTSTICSGKCNKATSLTGLAIDALENHDWPGNVRELLNVVERAILLETTDKIGLSSIVLDLPESSELPDSQISARPDHTEDFTIVKAERELIARALQETGWQKTQAATLLGITRATLYAKMKQYNVQRSSRIEEIKAKPLRKGERLLKI